jgi:acyl carrier protein
VMTMVAPITEHPTDRSLFPIAKDPMLDHAEAIRLVIDSLTAVLEMNDEVIPDALAEDTVIVGEGAVVDSLGVVSLIVEVEQNLEMAHDISVTLASDKAMSQRSSPFRTVGVLAGYVCELAGARR